MSLFKAIDVVTYHVKDWEGAKKFYKQVLEWPVAFCDDEMGWMVLGMEEGKTGLALSILEPDLVRGSQEGGVIAVFTVDDAVKTTELLRARGVKCDDAVNIPGMVCYGTFYDPEGNKLQFASDPKP